MIPQRIRSWYTRSAWTLMILLILGVGCADKDGENHSRDMNVCIGSYYHGVFYDDPSSHLRIWQGSDDGFVKVMDRRGVFGIECERVGENNFVALAETLDSFKVIALRDSAQHVITEIEFPKGWFPSLFSCMYASTCNNVAALIYELERPDVRNKIFAVGVLSATGEYRFLGRFELEKMGGSFNGWAIDDVAERIACASSVGGVALFASTTKEKVWQMTSKELGTSGVRSVAFSPDGKRVYASTTEGLLYCLDAKDGDILSKGVLARQGMLWSGKTPLERLRVSPDGRHVVGFSSASQTWIVWDCSAEQVVHSQRAPAGPGYPMNGLMITVFFGQDGAIGYVGIDGPQVFYKPSYPISNK